ncbi:rapid alkalinization factor-like [Rutidosis leptorrhynchoides]|uniref:rapid alkalinization factor-like n=1 Tax=Rutidosis leptorrhynchoides TaxID=125765 RepID=UPI003A9A1997
MPRTVYDDNMGHAWNHEPGPSNLSVMDANTYSQPQPLFLFYGVVFMAISVYFVVSSSMNVPFQPNWVALSHLSNGPGQLVRDVIDPDEEIMMESESARRILAGRGYISYGAMQKNNVPCNQRGQSYYDCNSRGQANPYSRGCNVITRCGGR